MRSPRPGRKPQEPRHTRCARRRGAADDGPGGVARGARLRPRERSGGCPGGPVRAFLHDRYLTRGSGSALESYCRIRRPRGLNCRTCDFYPSILSESHSHFQRREGSRPSRSLLGPCCPSTQAWTAILSTSAPSEVDRADLTGGREVDAARGPTSTESQSPVSRSS